jgi:hypothetical protein
MMSKTTESDGILIDMEHSTFDLDMTSVFDRLLVSIHE